MLGLLWNQTSMGLLLIPLLNPPIQEMGMTLAKTHLLTTSASPILTSLNARTKKMNRTRESLCQSLSLSLSLTRKTSLLTRTAVSKFSIKTLTEIAALKSGTTNATCGMSTWSTSLSTSDSFCSSLCGQPGHYSLPQVPSISVSLVSHLRLVWMNNNYLYLMISDLVLHTFSAKNTSKT